MRSHDRARAKARSRQVLEDYKASLKQHSNGDYQLIKSSEQCSLQSKTQQQFLTGWRVGALASLILAILVCILNGAITLHVWINPEYKRDGPLGTLFRGACNQARRSNVVIHLVVNILSILLLAASNYCMQVLSSPSGYELVQAHGQRLWLNIGVPSLRNLARIGRDRAAIWVLLLLSSVPLHLLFNSVIYVSLQANQYYVIPTTEGWLRGRDYDHSGFIYSADTHPDDEYPEGVYPHPGSVMRQLDALLWIERHRITMSDAANTTLYRNLTTVDCFEKYGNQYVSDVGNVYIIQTQPTVWHDKEQFVRRLEKDDNDLNGNWTWVHVNSSLAKDEVREKIERVRLPRHSTPVEYPSNVWRCPSHRFDRCDISNKFEVPKDRSRWEPFGSPVAYCLAERVEELCTLQFNFPFAFAVIAANIVKVICMAFMLLRYRNHDVLATLGDAIAYFLENPDPETRERCLHSRSLIAGDWKEEWEQRQSPRGIQEKKIAPKHFKPKVVRWGRAASVGRWGVIYVA